MLNISNVTSFYILFHLIQTASRICTPMLIAALFSQYPRYRNNLQMDKWINMWYTYVMEYCCTMKKKILLPIAKSWVKLNNDVIISKHKSDQVIPLLSWLWGFSYGDSSAWRCFLIPSFLLHFYLINIHIFNQ